MNITDAMLELNAIRQELEHEDHDLTNRVRAVVNQLGAMAEAGEPRVLVTINDGQVLATHATVPLTVVIVDLDGTEDYDQSNQITLEDGAIVGSDEFEACVINAGQADPLPSDHAPTNLSRAARAYLALQRFAAMTGMDFAHDDDLAVVLGDLLANLMHLSDAFGLDLEDDVQRARSLFYGPEHTEDPRQISPEQVRAEAHTIALRNVKMFHMIDSADTVLRVADAWERYIVATAWRDAVQRHYEQAAYLVLFVNDQWQDVATALVFDRDRQQIAEITKDQIDVNENDLGNLANLPVPHSSQGMPQDWNELVSFGMDGTDPVLVNLVAIPEPPRLFIVT